MAALTVLVVEDDAMIGMLLAEMLEEMGYAVCAVSATEDDAVAQAGRYHPGLIIADETLREGSGVAAVERILLAGPVPCVYISGAPVHLARPGRNVLQKPFLEADLVRAIGYVVARDDAPVAPKPAQPHVVLDV